MTVFVICICIQGDFFCEKFLYTQKAKNNPVYVRDLKKAQILRAILINKNEMLDF